VICYSGFYDMSAQLILGFGLDPGEKPDTFDFHARSETYHAKPDDPLRFVPYPRSLPQ
jgi:hypothetical protein